MSRLIERHAVFGCYTVIGVPIGGKNSRVLCRCECGVERLVVCYNLRRLPLGCRACKHPSGEYAARQITAGTVFGCWTVIGERTHGKNPHVLCRCDCGNEARVFLAKLVKHPRFCRECQAIEIPAGSVFGRWRTLEDRTKDSRVRCRCACGTVALVSVAGLRAADSTQCKGCASRASERGMRKAARKLGITFQAIQGRLKRGWSLKRAMTTPRVSR